MMTQYEEKLRQAAQQLAAGQLDAAADIYTGILQSDADCLDAINNMVKIAYHRQDMPAVEQYVQRSLAIKQDNFPFTLLLGGLYLQTNRIDEAVDYHHKAIAIDPQQKPFVLEQLGRGLLACEQIERARECFAEIAQTLGKQAQLDIVVAKRCKLDPEQAARGKPYYTHLKDILIEGDFWLIVDGECVYSDEITGRNPLNSPLVRGRADKDEQTLVIDVTRPAMHIDEPVIFLGGDSNYSHWLLRYLARLGVFEGNLSLDDYRFVVTSELTAWQKDSLEWLGIGDDRLVKIPRDRFAACKELIVATQLRSEATMGMAASWLRKKFCPTDIDNKQATRRVYISRRDASLRKLVNEEELISALQQRGFEIVTPSELSFAGQVALFNEAGVIIGPHGAGLTNIVFAPQCCVFIELTDKLCEHMGTFRWLARGIGQKCISLVSQDVDVSPDATQPQQEHSFRVNISEIMDVLDRELD